MEPFIRTLIGKNITEDFVAMTGESYMPCTMDESSRVIIKTWISRSSWTPETEGKLCQASDYLQKLGAVALIPSQTFSRTTYWDPGEISKYVVGTESFSD